MDIAHTETLERIARVLAGRQLSVNANGSSRSAGEAVDRSWRDHLEDATAVLNALREPDARMAQVGDGEAWTRMVRAALGEDVTSLRQERRSFGQQDQIYQKTLGLSRGEGRDGGDGRLERAEHCLGRIRAGRVDASALRNAVRRG